MLIFWIFFQPAVLPGGVGFFRIFLPCIRSRRHRYGLTFFILPVAHFRQYYRELAEQDKKKARAENLITLTYDPSETLDPGTSLIRNVGYIAFKRLYKDLELDVFWKKIADRCQFEYDLEKIFYLLVISRLMDPGSKKHTFEHKDQYFEPIGGFELEDVYKALTIIAEHDAEMQTWIYQKSLKIMERKTDVCYYDGTNYYFDICCPDTDVLDESGSILEKKIQKKCPSAAPVQQLYKENAQ